MNITPELLIELQKFYNYHTTDMNVAVTRLLTNWNSNFVFDKLSGNWFFGCEFNHSHLMGKLYNHHTGVDGNCYDLADNYIDNNFGMFKSSTSPNIYCGVDFLVPDVIEEHFSRDIRRME